MKKILFITIALFLLVNMLYSQCDPITDFPWTEGFENTETIPPCWEQEIEHSQRWQWVVVPAATGMPATAYEGTRKAQISLYFYGLPVYATKLITPVFDLTVLKEPMLKFWHTQINNGVGSLSVHYKNALDAQWTLLKSWHFESIPDWQEEIIILPEASAWYQIAFEGGFSGGSADVQLDAISVTGEPVGIASYTADQYLLVPNPVRDVLRINHSNTESITVTIYNAMGIMIHSFGTSETDFNMNVSDYASGVYLIRLSNSTTTVTKRFIKQ